MKRICLDCSTLFSGRGARCADCKRRDQAGRPTSTALGYTHRWRLLSTRYRRLRPLCELRYAGCMVVAADTDHRLPLRAGGKSTWANCQSVCRPCHRRKTAEDAARYAA